MSTTCTCDAVRAAKAGTHPRGGVEMCNLCNRAVPDSQTASPGGPGAVAENMLTVLDCPPGHHIVASYGLVTQLGATSGFTATSKGNAAMSEALLQMRRTAFAMRANAVVGIRASPFGAAGGITSAFGGDAVGVLLIGDAVRVQPDEDPAGAHEG